MVFIGQVRAESPLSGLPAEGAKTRRGIFRTSVVGGVYNLVATTAAGQVGIVRNLVINDTPPAPVEVAVYPGARIRVSIAGEPRAATIFVLVDGQPLFFAPAHAGQEHTMIVPTGTMTVRVVTDSDGPTEEQTATLSAGESRSLQFYD